MSRLHRFFFLLPLCMLLMASCQKGPALDETRTFAGGVWNRFKPEVFEVDVENPNDYYNITVELVVDTALMRNAAFPLTVNLYSPDSEHRMFYAAVPMRHGERWRGESAGGGRRVFKNNIREYFSFNGKGVHRMEIGQATSQYDLEGVRTLRVTVEKAEVNMDF